MYASRAEHCCERDGTRRALRRPRWFTALCCAAAWGVAAGVGWGAISPRADAPGANTAVPQAVAEAFLDDLEQRTFRFFWETANPDNGLVPDRFPSPSASSIAAVGFGLTAYPIGVERGYVPRQAARARALATLRFFAALTNEHGFYFHFIDMHDGSRARASEVSTVDTALLLGGVLFCESYFDGADPQEREIRALAEQIYRRVDWAWAAPRPPLVAMGFSPEEGFARDDWRGYTEAMLVYILALGSPSHPVPQSAWAEWTRSYERSFATVYGQKHLSFGPLFGHQYSHVWIDFRGIRDAWMRVHELDYFENSRRAAYAQRQYAIENPRHWQDYGPDIWGFTASDGPGSLGRQYRGERRRFEAYSARGVGPVGPAVRDWSPDDGTVAPTAAVSSMPFAPEIALAAARTMRERYGASLYSRYGFKDAFNASLGAPGDSSAGAGQTWVARDYLGIDQGPILAMVENYRSDLVWRVMRHNPHVRKGLTRAGFSGGWLADAPSPSPRAK